jgi:hypothetical protein
MIRREGGRIAGIPRPHVNPTALLLAWQRGEPDALDALLPLVYAELRRLAARYMRHEREDHTLPAAALVNKAISPKAGNAGQKDARADQIVEVG